MSAAYGQGCVVICMMRCVPSFGLQYPENDTFVGVVVVLSRLHVKTYNFHTVFVFS